jgi:cation diffusion facilitator CzcD-associated flavoprotein CzcO
VISTSLLVIGAGPYGLSTAAHAVDRGIDTLVVGRPMGFWIDNMPAGMFLRSRSDWHLDAAGVDTFEHFLDERAVAPQDVDPIPVDLFVEYADWFRDRKRLHVTVDLAVDVAQADGGFEVTCGSGETISAAAVVVAAGARSFTSVPDWAGTLPGHLAAHTCELTRLKPFAGSQCLIVGGRQSAYEWAALLGDLGATVDIVHRHDVPSFEPSDWTFLDPLIDRTRRVPGWWRRLPAAEQKAIARRFWAEGRLKLEPWLTARLSKPGIRRWPQAEVVDASTDGRTVAVRLSNGERLEADQVIFATGYRADFTRVPFLAGLLDRIQLADGCPVLDDALGASVDGLYVTGLAASRDFGPFFGFVRAAPTAAQLIVEDLLSRDRG